MDSRLTTTLALFRIEQDNLGQATGGQIPGSNGEAAYKTVDGTVSKGVEFEINGAITDNWQMTFGATRFVAEDNEGKCGESQPAAYQRQAAHPLPVCR
ncbi:OMR family iron-siderophore receptor [Klebsiella michiganensis]|nr:OMR family iron-siderophore receptor [Klebsiella michiganensis]